MKTLQDWQAQDMAAIARAIEADAGKTVTGLRASLKQAKAGTFAAPHSPEQLAARKRGRPAGSVKADAKVATTIRLDSDVLAALKASGAGWQTRVNDLLSDAVKRGKLAGSGAR